MINYTIIKPANRLRTYIDRLYVVSGEAKTHKDVPPRLGATLIFDFNKNTAIEGRFYKIALLGTRQKPYRLNTKTVNDRLVIHFSPTGLSAFYKFPVSTLNNIILNAEDIFGPNMLILYEELKNTIKIEKRIELIETFLWSHCSDHNLQDQLIVNLADLLRKNPTLSIHDIKLFAPVGFRQL